MSEAFARHEELVVDVAVILETQGFEVALEADVAGLRVDLLATKGRGRGRTRILVECKALSKLVGLRTARSFATTVQFLRETKHVKAGWLVALEGFTPRAREVAERFGIKVSTLSELRNEYSIEPEELRSGLEKLRSVHYPAARTKKRVFVVMPFTPEMDDVFLLGIRWVVNQLGIVAERADDLQHNGEIIGVIQRAIREYDGVIGDTTGANPNVCYEVGFAHALERPTVLLCRKGESLPFDLQGVNHLMYRNVVHLRERLPKQLKAALGL
ncbi:MAG: restriction endonuclease [Gemmatimonadetes bacterium]|nr:restriction endonuclease [Gemmatimonadota bacterium]MYJ17356.1 restriction endonuclease [Gemmatimonadota bacterium]